MLHILPISSHSEQELNLDLFLKDLEIPVLFEAEGTDEEAVYYYLRRPEDSTTYFVIADFGNGRYEVWMDGLASLADYRFFPFLGECLHQFLNKTPLRIYGKTVFEQYGEEWRAEAIGEEIATLKSVLSIAPRYYLTLPLQPLLFVSEEVLARVGTSLHSSTPRIYGYTQFLLRNHRLPQATAEQIATDTATGNEELTVDVPQHVSVGKVKSWQTDGAETWESYAQEDIDMLICLGERFKQGEKIDGVVLNDLGTLYQEGIGVTQDGYQAEYWFRQSTLQGDHHYAPTNLGDLYRKGCGALPPSLSKAYQAYLLSDDPYAYYRIGQAYEEGWLGTADREKAMQWYRKAAEAQHHLALKRLEKSEKPTLPEPELIMVSNTEA